MHSSLLSHFSLTKANRVPQELNDSWSHSCSQSALSSPRFPSIQTTYSPTYNSESVYSSSPTGPANSITIISEVPPAPRVIHIPLERLLNYDSNTHKVTIACSKYDEIGNPQARKRKQQRSLSGKKWHRTTSYANACSIQGQSRKENLNFMDKQLSSIYNSWEKAKIDKQLTLRAPRKELVTKDLRPPLPSDADREAGRESFRALANGSAERLFFNTLMRYYYYSTAYIYSTQ